MRIINKNMLKIIFTIITLSLLGFLPFYLIGKRMDKTEVEDMEDEEDLEEFTKKFK